MCIRDRATGRPYLVAAGETLLTIAAAHNLTPAALAAANGLTGLTPVSYTHLDVYKRQVY